MNLNPSHSQTPQFGNNKSQTTAILHREPTHEEMHGKPANFFSNICAFLLIVITVLALSYIYMRSSEREVQYQTEQSLARQAEYKGVDQ